MIEGLKLTETKLSVAKMDTDDIEKLVALVNAFKGNAVSTSLNYEPEVFIKPDVVVLDSIATMEELAKDKPEVVIPLKNRFVTDAEKSEWNKDVQVKVEQLKAKEGYENTDPIEPGVPETRESRVEKLQSKFPSIREALGKAFEEGKKQLPSEDPQKENGSVKSTDENEGAPDYWTTGIKMAQDGVTKKYKTYLRCPSCRKFSRQYIPVKDGKFKKFVTCFNCSTQLIVKPAVEGKPFSEENRDVNGNYLIAEEEMRQGSNRSLPRKGGIMK